MPTVTLPTGDVHYTEQGQGAPLVLLHANPGDSRDYEAVMPALAQHFRVLALDWPGYGQSAMPMQPQTRGAVFFYEVLREFLSMMGLSQVSVIGNSLGGNAAARLAIEAPQMVRALVLVSPGGFTAHSMVTRAFCRWQGSAWALSPRMWAGLYLRKRTVTTQCMLQRAATAQATAQATAPRLALNRAVWRSFAEHTHDLRPKAAGIQAPTLMLFGRYDPAIPAHKDGAQAAACMPSAQVVAMPCGHAPFAEVPDLFLAQVLPFLTSLEQQPASQASCFA